MTTDSNDSAPGRKCAILVVDDEAVIRNFMVRSLTRAGHEVTVVDDGDTALEHLDSHHYDIVFLDIVMPHMSGLTVLETIRARSADLPVVLITGYASNELVQTGARLGAYFMRKPFGSHELQKFVEALRKSSGNEPRSTAGASA